MYVTCSPSLLLSGGRDSPGELRQLAAGIILSCPGQYSSAVLGRSSQEYTQWLLKEQSWGGRGGRVCVRGGGCEGGRVCV